VQGCASVLPQHMCLPNRWPDTTDTKTRKLLERKHAVATGKLHTNCEVLFIKEYTSRATVLQRQISFNCFFFKFIFFIPRTNM